MVCLIFQFLPCCELARRPYHVVAHNAGAGVLDQVTVRYDKFFFEFGHIYPPYSKHFSRADQLESIPAHAVISWRDVQTGKTHRKTVDVKSLVPDGSTKGSIVFNIRNDDVTVSWKYD